MITASRKEYNDRYYAENHERLLAQKREYRIKNEEKVADQQRSYRERNKEKVAARQRRYFQSHRKERTEYDKRYRVANKDKITATIRAYFEKNKEGIYAYHRDYRRENMDKMHRVERKSKLKTDYGMSMQDFEAMLESQGGVCAICKSDDWGRTRGRPCVDHDHDTGRVRGILCHKCNVSLGLLRNDPAIILAAAEYLARKGAAFSGR